MLRTSSLFYASASIFSCICVVQFFFAVLLALFSGFLMVVSLFFNVFCLAWAFLLRFDMPVVCRRFYMALYCILRFMWQ